MAETILSRAQAIKCAALADVLTTEEIAALGTAAELLDAVSPEEAAILVSAIDAGDEVVSNDVVEATGTGTQDELVIGSGLNGSVIIKADEIGHQTTPYTVAIEAAVGDDQPMGAAITDKAITLTLGTGTGALDPAKNTAALVATAINALAGVSAVLPEGGTGADPFVISQVMSATPLALGVDPDIVSAAEFNAAVALINELKVTVNQLVTALTTPEA